MRPVWPPEMPKTYLDPGLLQHARDQHPGRHFLAQHPLDRHSVILPCLAPGRACIAGRRKTIFGIGEAGATQCN